MLGLPDQVLSGIEPLVQKAGLLLIAGPAASGRTTSAHALLTRVNVPGAKIWTVESPVEISRPGFSQIEANEKIGWDYATIVRSVMHADPDVILIGELRDRETAALAVEASLRGCLVLATLHGSSAAEAYARVVDMGVDAYSLADALLGVLSQRLARRLCSRCLISRALDAGQTDALLEEYCRGTPLKTADVRAEWNQRFGGVLQIHGANGCEVCGNTGYRGRIGLYELMPGGAAMRALLLQRRPVDELVAVAMQEGMRTLKQDGIEKALAGHCDMNEVHAATV
jgi:type II secretory ATPase GspE/PulE/Tfp pilus assembly ATPase PilB-like protein